LKNHPSHRKREKFSQTELLDLSYDRSLLQQSAVHVARQLIGFRLCRYWEGKVFMKVITETEAYMGEEDGASHARFGRTNRNAPMYGPPGIWYVYVCYGMHAMLNLVTGHENEPAAVLLRSVQNISGPGRLTQWFHVTRSLNGQPCEPSSGLWLLPPTERFSVRTAPRIGIDYAGKEWAQKPWRFVAEI
jgi:DNA-3-methyladenine glycosylase